MWSYWIRIHIDKYVGGTIMRKVYIKYNPYQVVTEVLIDGEPVKKNSELKQKFGIILWTMNTIIMK